MKEARAALLVAAALLAVPAVAGCEPVPARTPMYGQWHGSPASSWPGAAPPPPAYGATPVETRDPWWSAGAMPVAAAPAAPAATTAPAPGPFLVILDLRGPGGAERLPDAHATLARLGGVLCTGSLWEVAQQPGGGLGSLAATLERELCAEDVVIVYRSRNGGMERSEFAGHRACRAVDAPASTPPATRKRPDAAPRPPSRTRDPFHDRF